MTAPLRVASLLAVLATACAGCGSGGGAPQGASKTTVSSSSVAQQRLQRADLVIVSRGLQRAEGSIQREIAASKAAWPTVVQGLPSRLPLAARQSISIAELRTRQIATPRFISYAGELTGSSAAIAGLLLSYEGLSQRGWTFTMAAVNLLAGSSLGVPNHTASASPATARFMRSNASLYIGCVYDAHYNLSVIGEALQGAYRRLGGAASFGARLLPTEVEGLAHFYSPSNARLVPRPPPSPVGS